MDELRYDVFISYSSKEKDYAYELKDILENNGISCWIAPLSMPEGATYLSCAPQSLQQSRIFLLVLSEKSQESPWVSAEVESAFKYHKIIIPYAIDNAPMKDEFNFLLSKSQRIEAYNKKAESIATLVSTIKNTLEIPHDDTPVKKRLSAKVKILIAVLAVVILAAIAASPFIGSYIAGLDDIRGSGETYAESGEVTGEWQWRFDEGKKQLTVTGRGAMPDYDRDSYKKSPWYPVIDPYPEEVDLVIGEGITRVGDNNFLLGSLRSVTLPDTLTEIGDSAFKSNAFTEIKLPDSLQVIGERAFQSCEFVRVDLPPSLVSIGDHAFEGCFNLERVLINSPQLQHIGEDVFDCLDMEEMTFLCDNPYYATEDGVLYNADYTELVYYPRGKMDPSFVPAAGVKTIRANACTSAKFKTVTLRNSVTRIEDSAFRHCQYLTEITLPDSLTEIGKSAFANCIQLETVTLPDSVTELGDSLFFGCTNLRSITLPSGLTTIPFGLMYGTALSEFKVPDSVTELGAYVFADCDMLTAVTIPDGAAKIPQAAFSGCTALRKLTVPDSVTEIGPDAFEDVSKDLTIRCAKDSFIDGYARSNGIKTEYIR